MTSKHKPKLIARHKVAGEVVPGNQGLARGKIRKVTVRRSNGKLIYERGSDGSAIYERRFDGKVIYKVTRYKNRKEAEKRASFIRLSQGVGGDRARRLLTLSKGVERVVVHNRHRNPQQRRHEYRDTEFVEL